MGGPHGKTLTFMPGLRFIQRAIHKTPSINFFKSVAASHDSLNNVDCLYNG
jgi:hypothetical protein